MEGTHCDSPWIWDRDSSGNQEQEPPPLEIGTRELVRGSRPRGLSACVENCRQTVCETEAEVLSIIVNWR
jgi:hypothetical protein